jgi:peptide/nickel transport system permease protein
MADQPLALAPEMTVEDASPRRQIPRPGRPGRGWLRLAPFALFLVLALLVPVVLPHSPTSQDLSGRLTPPPGFGGSFEHPMGTDGLGRDLLARIALGARSSLVISVVAATGAAVIGVLAGVVSGVVGGLIDRAITMLVEMLLAVPFITAGLMITATIGQSMTSLLLLLILTGWITHARIIRLQAQTLVHAEFIDAARAFGGSRLHIVRHHIVPNLLPTAIVVLFQQMGSMLLWSASLTYLGIGLPIDQITLGGIIREGQELIYTAWWVSVFGGLAIALAVAGFNLTADWARARLDPTRR